MEQNWSFRRSGGGEGVLMDNFWKHTFYVLCWLKQTIFFKASQEAKTEEKVDIMQLFAKAQERYNKQVQC